MESVAESTTKQLSLLKRLSLWWGRDRVLREDQVMALKLGAVNLGVIGVKLEEIKALLDDFNEQFYLATQQKRVNLDKNTFTGQRIPEDPHPEEKPGIYMQDDAELAMLETLERLKGRRGPEVTLDDPLVDEDLGFNNEENQQ